MLVTHMRNFEVFTTVGVGLLHCASLQGTGYRLSGARAEEEG